MEGIFTTCYSFGSESHGEALKLKPRVCYLS